MSNINTENLASHSPLQKARAGVDSFAEQFVSESFDEHLRQAFRPAVDINPKHHSSDADRKIKRHEQSQRELREHRHEDPDGGQVSDRPGDAVADDANASAPISTQDNQPDSQNSQDDSGSAESETTNAGGTENRVNDGPAQSRDVDNQQAQKEQATSSLDEPTELRGGEDSQHSLQANHILEQSAAQQSNNSTEAQAGQIGANMSSDQAALESAANPDIAAAEIQSNTGAGGDVPQVVQLENSTKQTQNNQQAVESDYADAAADNNGHREINTGTDTADEVAQEMATPINTGKEAATQDPSAQSQVVADKMPQEKVRRDTDSSQTDVDVAQAAASPAASADGDAFKSARNAAEKIAADAMHKDKTDSKATSNQLVQNDISLSGRGQAAQDARTATAVQTAQTAGNEDLDTTDRVRFVQRIARAFEGAGRDGGTMRMRLHPSELGQLRLEVTIRDGALTARMETETQAAKNIILDSLPALRERLAQQDIKIQQFDVDYSGGNSDGSPQSAADQHQPHQRPAARQIGSRAAGNAETENENIQAPLRARLLGQASRLDFVA